MSQTSNLGLNKHDNVTTNTNQFDIENYLNHNWDLIDEEAGNKEQEISNARSGFDTLEDVIKQKMYHFDTVAEMKACEQLVVGDVVETLGYTYKDDKGTGTYEIVSEDTSASSIVLDNNLVAKLIKDDSKVEYIFPNRWQNCTIGDVFIIKALGKNLLFDSHRDTEWNKVKSFLDDNNTTHIDYFFLSHYHSDHMGNFVNLVNNGYIDSNTILYMPQTSTTISASSLYQTVHNCITTNNFIYTIPQEFEILNLGMNISLEFYNTDPAFIETASQIDWNNCSMLIMFRHKNIKSLFTGDAYRSVFTRALTNGFIKEKINMLKLPHHGMITSTMPSTRTMQILRPDYAIQTGEILDHQQSFSLNPDVSYLAGIGTKFWATYNSDEYIIFKSNINALENVQGKPIENISNCDFVLDVYVDANSSNLIQDGKQETPFISLQQALSRVERYAGGTVTIHLSDGDYCVGTPTSSSYNGYKPTYMGNDTKIIITGNTSNVSAVKIHNGFNFYNAKVQLNGLTIYTNISDGIYSENSDINLNRINITSEDENATTNNGIIAYDMSRIVLMSQVTISKCKEGIRTNNSSIVDIIGATISDNTTGISNNFSTINVLRSLTTSNNTTDIYNNIGKVNREIMLPITNAMLNTGLTREASYDYKIVKQNQQIHISVVIKNSNNFSSSAVTLLTLAESYRPAKNVKALVGFGNSANEIEAIGYCVIKTTGEIEIHNDTGTDYQYVTIDTNYYSAQI
jgi:beta-lactamase superfamily II metal-dependent hydrolase